MNNKSLLPYTCTSEQFQENKDTYEVINYIRVIAVSRVISDQVDLACLLWYEKEDFAVRVVAKVGIVGAGIRQSVRDLFTAFIKLLFMKFDVLNKIIIISE